MPVHASWFETALPLGPAFGDPEDMTWGSLKAVLSQRREGGKDGTGFIGARFKPEPNGQVRRKGANLVARTLIVLDIETDKRTGEVPPPPDDAAERIRKAGWAAVAYTSHNHRADAPRYRVVVPLAEEIDPELPAVEVVADALGLTGVCDRSKTGAGSLFYCASAELGQLDRHQTIIIDGAPIDTAWIRETAGKLLAERRAEQERIAAAAREQAEAKRRAKIAAGDDPEDSIIEKIRACLGDLEQILLSHGYEKLGSKFRHPGSTSGQFGADIKVIGGVERVFSHNANDPLHAANLPPWCGGVTAIDAVDVITILAFAGDRTRALRELAERFGFSKARGRGEGGQGKGNGAGPPPPPPPGPDDEAESEGDPGPRPGDGPTGQNAASFRDPWDQPPPPEWPSGILPARFADMIAALATGSGVDPGVVAISALLAISGAAPKNCRLKPYGDNHSFVVPPILWAMSVASSGQRKTYLNEVFAALKHHRNEAWHDYQIELADWNALDKQSKKETPKPREPFSCLVQDITPEKLAEMLAENDRGTLYQRDELSSFFGFGRYSNDRGTYERSLYLEAYDGDQFLSQRITRPAAYVKHTAVSVFGSIQPRRLQKLSVDDLGADGLLQRFIVIMPRKVSISQSPDTNMGVVPGRAEFNRIVAQLLGLGSLFGREFRATPDGAQIIYRLEELGLALGEITDYGPVFPEFCAKLHGTAARLAFVLHFLDNPAADMHIVMPETIARADRLVREYVLPHGRDFYAEISEEGPERTRAIAAWLLSGAPDRITASDFGKHVRPCRGLRLRDLNNALDPLVGGGWLIPENPYPSNNAWTLDTNVRTALAHRVAAATAQRERNRQLAESIGSRAKRSG